MPAETFNKPSAYEYSYKSEEYEKVKANYETDNTTTTELESILNDRIRCSV
jgi:hypothetical protein